MSKKEETNIQNETILKKLSLNAKKELLKYDLLNDLINYKYTILLDSVDINDVLSEDEIGVYYNDFINNISDFELQYIMPIEYLKSSILVVRFYDELNLKILNEIIGKIKKNLVKKYQLYLLVKKIKVILEFILLL